MKNLTLIILTVFITIGTINLSIAQSKKTALEVPSIFYPPKDDPKVKNLEEFNTIKIPEIIARIDGIAWSVFCDRVGNVTDSGIALEFKDQFYVIDENDTKIHIVQGTKNNKNNLRITVDKDFGWIEKGKMLLWDQALIHPIKKINRKGFLLNKASMFEDENFDDVNKFLVHALNTPTPTGAKSNIEDTIRIYDFYFILKKVKRETEKDSLYLLSKNVNINGLFSHDDIIGWVDSDRITDWNTRLALEPNFDMKAYNERKANSQYQVKLFDEAENAIGYAKESKISDKYVRWDHDPVSLPAAKLAESDPKRFPGNVIRFPLIDRDKDLGIYKTAAVCEITLAKLKGKGQVKGIDIINAAPFLDDIDQYISAKRNVNIVYVIENAKSTRKYVDLISKSMLNISRDKLVRGKTVQYGAAFYAGANEFDYEALSTDLENVIDFINNKPVSNSYQKSIYSGLTQALKKVGLKKDENNIVVLIGSNGDVGQRIISSKDVEQALIKRSTNLVAINCGSGNSASLFKQHTREMLIETAKGSSNKCRIPWTSLRHKDPVFVENTLTNADFYGSHNEVANLDEMSDILDAEITKAIKFTNDITKMLEEIFNEGKAAPKDMGVVDAAINRVVCELATKNNLSQEDIKKLAYEKYELYLDVKAPLKINAAEHDYFSNVLFLPRKDLVDLRDRLRTLVYSENSTPNKKREDLRNAWIELLRIYTGETNSKDLSRYIIEDWIKIYTGLEGEDVQIGKESILQGKSLDDIADKNEVSNSDINAYISEVSKNYTILDNILKENRYEFSYTSNDNTYYWIPVEYLP